MKTAAPPKQKRLFPEPTPQSYSRAEQLDNRISTLLADWLWNRCEENKTKEPKQQVGQEAFFRFPDNLDADFGDATRRPALKWKLARYSQEGWLRVTVGRHEMPGYESFPIRKRWFYWWLRLRIIAPPGKTVPVLDPRPGERLFETIYRAEKEQQEKEKDGPSDERLLEMVKTLEAVETVIRFKQAEMKENEQERDLKLLDRWKPKPINPALWKSSTLPEKNIYSPAVTAKILAMPDPTPEEEAAFGPEDKAFMERKRKMREAAATAEPVKEPETAMPPLIAGELEVNENDDFPVEDAGENSRLQQEKHQTNCSLWKKVKRMRQVQLRKECRKRKLPQRGNNDELKANLYEAMKKELSAEEEPEEEKKEEANRPLKKRRLFRKSDFEETEAEEDF